MNHLTALRLAAGILAMSMVPACAEQPPPTDADAQVAAGETFTGFARAAPSFPEAFARLLDAARNGDRGAADSLLGHWRTIGYVPPEQEAPFYAWLAATEDTTGSSVAERREAAFRAGVLYHDGRGVAQDHAAAARWWRQAAEAGHREAQYQLGRLYSEGIVIARDDREAHHWLAAASRENHAGAQFWLGVLFQYGGEAVPPDMVEAYRWYSLAAQGGHALAEDHRRALHDDLSPDDLAQVHRTLGQDAVESPEPAVTRETLLNSK